MREATALEVAIGLLHLPSRARTLRAGDLPTDLETLLLIVAGDDRALADALQSTGSSEQTVRAAASFYIEQVLLHPDADSYRVLGVNPDATTDKLRRHMALLLRWLHPDRDVGCDRAIFVSRITDAWNNLKTAERRAVYDAGRRSPVNDGASGVPVGSRPGKSARGFATDVNGRHRRSADQSGRDRRLTPVSVWHFLRHLMGQSR